MSVLRSELIRELPNGTFAPPTMSQAIEVKGGLGMRGLADIHLDVRGGDIIVDLPGTSYTVTYHNLLSVLSFSLPTHQLKTTLGPS